MFTLLWYTSTDYQIIIEAESARAHSKIAKIKGVCKVAGEVVSEAEVMFNVVEG